MRVVRFLQFLCDEYTLALNNGLSEYVRGNVPEAVA